MLFPGALHYWSRTRYHLQITNNKSSLESPGEGFYTCKEVMLQRSNKRD